MSKLSVLLDKEFYVEAGIRAAKTFAQSAVALITASATGLLDVDWGQTFSVAGLSAVLSVLTSVASADSIVPPPPADSEEPPAPVDYPELDS